MRGQTIAAALAMSLALLGCTEEPSAAVDPYHGPYPSREAEQALRALVGHWFRDPFPRRGETVFLDRYPPPDRRRPPLIWESGAKYLVQVPLRTDGDAADLYRRITGKEHPTLKGEMSADYKAFLKGKAR